jgi:His/Glu/Gln/Arg/opine family amino acid ABC transporter permease subunit
MNLEGVNFRWSLIWENRVILLKGLGTAIAVSITALLISLIIGLILALARMSEKRLVSILASSYVNIFRGIPALVSVIWVYFGWSLLFGYNFTVYQAGVIALTLLYSAFFCEIYRAALIAVPKGQREAGFALGMTRFRIFVSIIMPQATKIAIPNIGSMYIGMVKDTSTFAVVGLVEVVRVTQNLNSINFQPFVLYTAAAALYVFLAFIVDFIFRAIEKNLSSPPSGSLSNALTKRRRERIQVLIAKANQ